MYLLKIAAITPWIQFRWLLSNSRTRINFKKKSESRHDKFTTVNSTNGKGRKHEWEGAQAERKSLKADFIRSCSVNNVNNVMEGLEITHQNWFIAVFRKSTNLQKKLTPLLSFCLRYAATQVAGGDSWGAAPHSPQGQTKPPGAAGGRGPAGDQNGQRRVPAPRPQPGRGPPTAAEQRPPALPAPPVRSLAPARPTCWSHSGHDLVAIFTFLARVADMLPYSAAVEAAP